MKFIDQLSFSRDVKTISINTDLQYIWIQIYVVDGTDSQL
jgi:hypothetical protein